jgi:hypothetical protein
MTVVTDVVTDTHPNLRRPPHKRKARNMTRVQVTGDLFHGQVPDGAVYVGRQAPGLRKSPYANPFAVKTYGLAESLKRYRLHSERFDMARLRRDLAGRDLACWCPLDQPCHADVLLGLASQPELPRILGRVSQRRSVGSSTVCLPSLRGGPDRWSLVQGGDRCQALA